MKIPANILKSFLEDEFGEVREKGDELSINSPFTNDLKFHMYINPGKGVFNDFKTSNSGLIINFISEYLSLNRKEVVKYLIKKYYSVSDRVKIEKILEEETLLELPEKIYYFSEVKEGIIRDRAYNYLKNRGISENNINKLGFIYDNSSIYHNSIFIPFYENNELVYFITRDYTGLSKLRYKNPKKLDSKNFVYNIDNIKDDLFIFEGVFDALTLDNQIGTATLSADISPKQIKKIKRKNPNRIIFCPDTDETGKDTLLKNIGLFKQYMDIPIYIYDIKKGKDFNSSGENFININECRKYDKTQEIIRRLI